jgi:hypothetical protein
LPERGGAWLFLRWLGDQKGDEIFGRLVQTRLTSVENVQEQGGESFQALFGDFAIAAAADISTVIDRNLLDPRYRFERDFRTIFDFVQTRFAKPFPSPVTYTAQTEIPATPTLVASAMVDGTMAFYSFRTSAIVESAVALRFTESTLTPFDPLLGAQVGIIRVR